MSMFICTYLKVYTKADNIHLDEIYEGIYIYENTFVYMYVNK